MDKRKIGTIFMVSVLALAGIGISYAGLTDTIKVYGTVSTGTVDLVIDDYSGTWVWKVYDASGEIVITNDPAYSVSPAEGFLVSYAKGRPIAPGDPEGYDAAIEFDNLFPCIDFMADIVFHYVGTIPAKVTDIDWDWEGQEVTKPDGTVIDDFITWLMDNGHMTGGFYRCDADGVLLEPLEEVTVGYQLHECNYFKLIVTIHLPQENWLQGLQGSGYVNIGVLQWNDQCEPDEEFDIEVTKTASDETPLINTPFDYTITAKNLGPGDATGVIVTDTLPADVQYNSHIASKGTYDHTSGIWNIGDLAAGQTATLTINVEIPVDPGTGGYTQLALLLDGSTSILPADWTIMKEGIALAITNGYIPHNGQVELTVIQFGGWTDNRAWAQLELLSFGGPVVLTEGNYMAVASAIQAIPQISESPAGGGTAMSCAFRLAADVMSGDPFNKLTGTPWAGMASPNYNWPRQVVNLVTDGQPNIIYDDTNRYTGTWADNGGPNEFVLGKADTEAALAYFLSLIPMVEAEGDEIDAEAVGTATDIPWLRDYIVWPQPGYDDWPPTGPGWVRYIDDYTEFAETLYQKFEILFPPIENCAELTEPLDINPDNNVDCVTVTPQYVTPG